MEREEAKTIAMLLAGIATIWLSALAICATGWRPF
jgi:hypothetical protein